MLEKPHHNAGVNNPMYGRRGPLSPTFGVHRFGKDAPCYKHGKTLEKHFCVDCGITVSNYRTKRCHSCAAKFRKSRPPVYYGEKHRLWSGGRPKCLDCGKEIKYKATRCKDCRVKYIRQHPEETTTWRGGTSRGSYPLGWSKHFKEQIRQRDNYKCQMCGCPETECFGKIPVHHIDYDKHNLSLDNLITLCGRCHAKTNFKREKWIQYFKDKQGVSRVEIQVT